MFLHEQTLKSGWVGGLKFFTAPHPPLMVGTLFLMMFECIFKFDGQIETVQIEIVHVFNLTRLIFFNGPCITLHMTCLYSI